MDRKRMTRGKFGGLSLESGHEWKNYITRWAGYLGFARVGFAKAERRVELAEALLNREKLGLVTPFVDTPVPLRTDPREAWPECRTVVALAYPLPLSLRAEEGQGALARSAVGEDYHAILRRLLTVLAERMKLSGWPGQEIRQQVDTGPLVERFWAAQAGIGWIGKNQQLIVPHAGSFVALALLLLDRELPTDRPMADSCGACCLCQDACPARILGRDHFDAERCLSYLTQTKVLLAREEMSLLGNRIFGCDACQEACPHNRLRLEQEELLRTAVQLAKAAEQDRGDRISRDQDQCASVQLGPDVKRYSSERSPEKPQTGKNGSTMPAGGIPPAGEKPGFPAEAERAAAWSRPLCRGVDLVETLSLTNSTFKRKYGSSAAGWRGKGILQRNAWTALTNAKDGRLWHWLNERENGRGIPAILTPYLSSGSNSDERE